MSVCRLLLLENWKRKKMSFQEEQDKSFLYCKHTGSFSCFLFQKKGAVSRLLV